MVKKESVHKTFLVEKQNVQIISLQAFPSYRPLKKACVDSPTAVIDRVKCIYKGDE
jgi:hypothetical protein